MAGRLSVGRGEGVSLGPMACAHGMAGLISKGGRPVLSRSRSKLWWMSAVRDTIPLLVLLVSSSPSLRVELSSVLRLLPPGSCTKLHLLVLTPPGSNVCL